MELDMRVLARRLEILALEITAKMDVETALKTLGLQSLDQIDEKKLRSIYRDKLKRSHPDKFQGDEKESAERKSKDLGEAYEVLSRMLVGDMLFDGVFVKEVSFERLWPKLVKKMPKGYRPDSDDPFMQKYQGDQNFKDWYSHDAKYRVYKKSDGTYTAYIFRYWSRQWDKYDHGMKTSDLREFVASLKPTKSPYMAEFEEIVKKIWKMQS